MRPATGAGKSRRGASAACDKSPSRVPRRGGTRAAGHTMALNAVMAPSALAGPRPCMGNVVVNWLSVPMSPM